LIEKMKARINVREVFGTTGTGGRAMPMANDAPPALKTKTRELLPGFISKPN
jgi:hypothetical protein